MKHWLLQLAGASVLLLLVWAFLNTPDDHIWNVALTIILGLAAFASATWLIANNFTAKLTRVAGCLLATLLMLWLLDRFEASSLPGTISSWITSVVALKLKKPLGAGRVDIWLDWVVFFARWIVLPLLFIPLVAKPTRYWRFALIYLVAFVVGAVMPHYLIHWVPKLHGFWPQLLSAAVRFLVAYLVLVTAWVQLGRSLRAEART